MTLGLKSIIEFQFRIMDNHIEQQEKKVLNFEDFIKYTGFSKSVGYKLTHEKRIPFYKPTGGKLFFKKEEVDLWLTRNRVASQDEIERRATQHCLSA